MKNRKILAITDDERDYAVHLMEYLCSDSRIQTRIAVYTGTDKLLNLADPKVISLLVIAESEYTKEVETAGFAKVLVLNETDRYLTGVRSTSKYQPMDTIADEILALLSDEEGEMAPSVRHGGRLCRIGFYSPIPGCLQTSAVLCLASLLAEEAPSLILNFEPLSGLSHLLSKEFAGDLSELVYYSDCAKEKVAGHLASILVRAGSADLVPPLQNPADLNQVKAEQWLGLFEAIGEVTDYGYLVLDLSGTMQGLFEILDSCDFIFMMTKDGSMAEAKLAEFHERLTRGGQENLLTRVRQLPVPASPVEDALDVSGPLARFLAGEVVPVLARGADG